MRIDLGQAVVLAAAMLAAAGGLTAAQAGPGKAGLWDITVTMKMAGMPAIPTLSPEQQAKMKAMGVPLPKFNGHTVTTQHCVSPAEAASDKPPTLERADAGCKTANTRGDGRSMSAELICDGRMQGHGSMTLTYDSPEHYTGHSSFQGTTTGGLPVDMSNDFTGQWRTADCGAVKY